MSQYNKREHHFCSNKCQSLLKREKTYENRKCEICDSIFYVSKRSTQRFCSNKCQNEWQRSNIGFKNPKFQGDYVNCETCGKRYIVGKTVLDSGRHHFCSTKCRRKWYSTVWSQTDEWKDKIRKHTVNYLNTCPATTKTKPQIITNNILDNMNISYRNEESFVYYSVDNYLTDYNLIIEVMGDYWHSSPLKYPNKLNDKQKHIVCRDKAKHTYIKKYYGIDILYLWEYDVLNRADVCIALISSYISNEGNLENYNSFNYSINDSGELILNNIIYSYQEREIAC